MFMLNKSDFKLLLLCLNLVKMILRHRSSRIKSDLLNTNIIDNRNSCAEIKNAEHYFFCLVTNLTCNGYLSILGSAL